MHAHTLFLQLINFTILVDGNNKLLKSTQHCHLQILIRELGMNIATFINSNALVCKH